MESTSGRLRTAACPRSAIALTAPNIYKLLNKGKWERPTDKMAVYTEIEPGQKWGIRVTLLAETARVEAINGPKCSWYQAPKEISAEVRPPNFFERLRRIRFADKLMLEVAAKRAVAAQNNGKGRYFESDDSAAGAAR